MGFSLTHPQAGIIDIRIGGCGLRNAYYTTKSGKQHSANHFIGMYYIIK